jgi:hypothetical protein
VPDIGLSAVRVAVLYYGTEVLLSRQGPIRSVLPAVAAVSLLVFAVRGLL